MEIEASQQIKKEIELNRGERLKFISLWADYVKTHRDIEWSLQQNSLVNPMFKNAQNYPLTKNQYLEIKAKKANQEAV